MLLSSYKTIYRSVSNVKKRFLTLFLCLSLILSLKSYGFESIQECRADSQMPFADAGGVVVMEANSGRIIYSRNMNQKLPMASTTKILTTLIALEQSNIEEEFTVKEKDFIAEGSSMGLRDGDKVSLETLCYGMILPSGNDAANATAVKIAGSKEKFADMMNAKAEEIGMYDSHFVTPSGLDDENHYSTAHDMGILTCKALKNEKFKEICGMYTKRIMLGNPPTERTLVNYNKLLNRYDYCTGVKTGYTDNARRCLISSACKNGIDLVIVTLNCHDDFNFHTELYEYFFDKLKLYDLSEYTDNIYLNVAGMDKKLKAEVLNIPLVPLFDGEKEKIKAEVTCDNIIYQPIEKGQYLGEVKLMIDKELIYKTDLVSPVKTEIINKKSKIHFISDKFMIK